MIECSVAEAQAQLSALIEAVQAGEEVILSEAGRPVAGLVRYPGAMARRELGALRGRIWIVEDLDELPGLFPLPEGWERPLIDPEADEILNHGGI